MNCGDCYSHISSLARFLSISVNSLTCMSKTIIHFIFSLVRYLLSKHILSRQFKTDYELLTPKVIFIPNSFISSNIVINLRDKKCTEEHLKNCLQLWDSVTLH